MSPWKIYPLHTLADIAFALNANANRPLGNARRAARNGYAEKLTGLIAGASQRGAV